MYAGVIQVYNHIARAIYMTVYRLTQHDILDSNTFKFDRIYDVGGV